MLVVLAWHLAEHCKGKHNKYTRKEIFFYNILNSMIKDFQVKFELNICNMNI